MTLDPYLAFDQHITNLQVSSFMNSLCQVNRVKKCFVKEILVLMLYRHSLWTKCFTYCSTVWSNTSSTCTHIKKLQLAQNFACGIIYNYSSTRRWIIVLAYILFCCFSAPLLRLLKVFRVCSYRTQTRSHFVLVWTWIVQCYSEMYATNQIAEKAQFRLRGYAYNKYWQWRSQPADFSPAMQISNLYHYSFL